jgi:hypothetical protein
MLLVTSAARRGANRAGSGAPTGSDGARRIERDHRFAPLVHDREPQPYASSTRRDSHCLALSGMAFPERRRVAVRAMPSSSPGTAHLDRRLNAPQLRKQPGAGSTGSLPPYVINTNRFGSGVATPTSLRSTATRNCTPRLQSRRSGDKMQVLSRISLAGSSGGAMDAGLSYHRRPSRRASCIRVRSSLWSRPFRS